jgi:hypothetical protein
VDAYTSYLLEAATRGVVCYCIRFCMIFQAWKNSCVNGTAKALTFNIITFKFCSHVYKDLADHIAQSGSVSQVLWDE